MFDNTGTMIGLTKKIKIRETIIVKLLQNKELTEEEKIICNKLIGDKS